MPIYDYACDKCGHEFHAEQRITDAPLKTCPECRSRKVRRLISRTSFVLKGSGWYSDLYSSTRPGGDSGAGEKTEGSKSEASDKPAAKSDAKSDKKSGKGGKKGSKAAA
jgi:putative FmdB family regulatory protein